MSFAIQLIVSPLVLALAASPPAAGLTLRARSAPETTPEAAPSSDEPDSAKADPQLERAMESYNLGTAAYNAARYDDALGHFQAAATLYASADFQYNIGLCYERLDKPEEAIRAYKTYLRAKPDASDRANVEDRIFQLEKEIEESKNKPDPVEPDPVEPDPVEPPPEPSDSNTGRGLIIGGAVMAGVGAAIALGGGIGFGVAAGSRSDDVDAVYNGNPDELTFEQVNDLDEDGRQLETFQIVTAAIGAAVAVGGVALLAVGFNKRKKAAAGPSASLVPAFGRRSAGLSLTGRF